MSAVARAPTALMLMLTLNRSLHTHKKKKTQEHTCTHRASRAFAHPQQLELPPCIHQKDGCGAMEKSTVPQCPSWSDLWKTQRKMWTSERLAARVLIMPDDYDDLTLAGVRETPPDANPATVWPHLQQMFFQKLRIFFGLV